MEEEKNKNQSLNDNQIRLSKVFLKMQQIELGKGRLYSRLLLKESR